MQLDRQCRPARPDVPSNTVRVVMAGVEILTVLSKGRVILDESVFILVRSMPILCLRRLSEPEEWCEDEEIYWVVDFVGGCGECRNPTVGARCSHRFVQQHQRR